MSLGMKRMGARNAGNPRVACDVEGAGNVERSGYLGRPARQSSTLLMSGDGRRGDAERPATAPILDSTDSARIISNELMLIELSPETPK
jgi:hypothetical protein